jgi:hypothetical protein
MRKYILITLLPVLLYSCKTVNSFATSPAAIPVNKTDYSFVGHVRLVCQENDFEETYDYVLANAIDLYGPGVDVVNITKDYVYDHGFWGFVFPIFFKRDVYLNAFVIKYNHANNIEYIDITERESRNIEDSVEDSSDELELTEDIVQDQNEDKLSGLQIGDRVKFIIDNDHSKTFVGEVIKILDNNKIAVSYLDLKGRTQRQYIKTEDIIVE